METRRLDITREHCPMTFVLVKLELARLAPGDRLEVLLGEGEPLNNVPQSAAEQGFRVLSVERVSPTTHRVLIEK